MASSEKSVDCFKCKDTFDEQYGVWFCLKCSQKLIDGVHHATSSPKPRAQQQSAFNFSPRSSPVQGPVSPPTSPVRHHRPHRNHHLHRRHHSDSLRAIHSESVQTLFLELANNGNKRRFKYRPTDLHRGANVLEIEQHLLKRFGHDVQLRKLISSPPEMRRLCRFEINDRRHRHQMVLFEDIEDLFDGAQIRIELDAEFFAKHRIKARHVMAAAPNMKVVRQRSKSTSSLEIDVDCKTDLPVNPMIGSPRSVPSHRVRGRSFPETFSSNLDDGACGQMDCIVVDNGSWSIKCGIGGALGPRNGPQVVVPSVSKSTKMWTVRRGLVADWSQMERKWKELLTVNMAKSRGISTGYDVTEHAVLMMLRWDTPKEDRVKITEILFESMGVAAVSIQPNAPLALFGTGKTKGVVLDIGEGVTSVIAMNDGIPIRSASKTVDFGGGDVTRAIMEEKGISRYLHSTRLKERWYSCPFDEADALSASKQPAVWTLPDGTQLELGRDRMDKPLHALFADSKGNEHGAGRINASLLVNECLERSKLNLAQHLVLSGGATMMEGFAERFSKEIKLRSTRRTAVKIEKNRTDLPWIGGSVLSQFSRFKTRKLITRNMYHEQGHNVVEEFMTL